MPRALEMPSIAIGVFINPGMMAFTRMPYLALAKASWWVMAFTPDLETLYANNPPTEHTAAMDEILRIDPPPCVRITGIICLQVRNTLFMFTLRMRSQAA